MVLSQFFILSPRGDAIISKDFRGDCSKDASDIFFRKVKLWKGDAPPVFVRALVQCTTPAKPGTFIVLHAPLCTPLQEEDGTHFLHVKRGGLLFAVTTKVGVRWACGVSLVPRFTAALLRAVQRFSRIHVGTAGSHHQGVQGLLWHSHGRKHPEELRAGVRAAG